MTRSSSPEVNRSVAICYYRNPFRDRVQGGDSLWQCLAIASTPGGYSESASGASAHQAYIGILNAVRRAEALGRISSSELSEFLDERHYPPAERFMRIRDGGRIKKEATADGHASAKGDDEMTEQEKNEIIAAAYIAAAEAFEVYASDQIASKRWQTTAQEKRDCDIRAGIWADAAKELREAATK